MIKGFRSKTAQDVYDGINSRQARRLPKSLHKKAQRLIDQINAVTRVETLQRPPSNHLQKLAGNLRGFWSIRINKQWRIIFQWQAGDAYQVDIVDYH